MPNWEPRFSPPRVEGTCYALAAGGGELFAGGTIRQAGGRGVGFVARWNQTTGQWAALGAGTDGPVYALSVDGDSVYVGGSFTTAGGLAARGVARWDRGAERWGALGTGVSASGPWPAVVRAIAVNAGEVWVGGHFDVAGERAAQNVACWRPAEAAWSPPEAGLGGAAYSEVRAMVFVEHELFVGGQFDRAGDAPARNVARRSWGAWSALGEGTNGAVSALSVLGSDLIVGGTFTEAGGAAARHLGAWSHVFHGWRPFGADLDGEVKAMCRVGGNIYFAGRFAGRVRGLELSSGEWIGPGRGAEGAVHALAAFGPDLIAGGGFNSIGAARVGGVARWNGVAWAPLSGEGADGAVNAVVAGGPEVWAGGTFRSMAGVDSPALARRDGEGWRACPNPFVEVHALALAGDRLIAAGDSGRVASYSRGSGSWSELHGLRAERGPILALAVRGSEVYAGGGITFAAGARATYLARWNGSWSPLGELDGIVRALAFCGDELYVGGSFVRGIRRWSSVTGSWSELGSGVAHIDGPAEVSAIAVRGSQVFVGGRFTTAGGVGALHVGRWDAAVGAWHVLGEGTAEPVTALACHGADVYAAGPFGVAVWSGGVWSPVAASAGVSALASGPGGVWAAGTFASIDGLPSAGLGLWDAPRPEARPRVFLHVTTPQNSLGNVTWINDPACDGKRDVVLIVTANATPGGRAAAASNARHVGVWFDGARWTIYNQDRAPMPAGVAFNVLVVPSGGDPLAFSHTVSRGNRSSHVTWIEHPVLNSGPHLTPLVTQNYSPAVGGGVYNPHPVGLWFGGRWSIYNDDLAPMPEGAGFNLFLADGAATHVAAEGNTRGDTTWVDASVGSSRAEALLFVTHVYDPPGTWGTYVPHPLTVVYDARLARWGIRTADGAPMPVGAGFFVKAY